MTPALDLDGNDLSFQLEGNDVSTVDLGDVSNLNYGMGTLTTPQQCTATGYSTDVDIQTITMESGDIDFNTSTDGITVSSDGIYELSWSGYVYQSSAAGTALFQLYVNSGAASTPEHRQGTSGINESVGQTVLLDLNASDVVYLKMGKNSQNFYIDEVAITMKKL